MGYSLGGGCNGWVTASKFIGAVMASIGGLDIRTVVDSNMITDTVKADV